MYKYTRMRTEIAARNLHDGLGRLTEYQKAIWTTNNLITAPILCDVLMFRL